MTETLTTTEHPAPSAVPRGDHALPGLTVRFDPLTALQAGQHLLISGGTTAGRATLIQTLLHQARTAGLRIIALRSTPSDPSWDALPGDTPRTVVLLEDLDALRPLPAAMQVLATLALVGSASGIVLVVLDPLPAAFCTGPTEQVLQATSILLHLHDDGTAAIDLHGVPVTVHLTTERTA
jgi:hypothetical protein